MMRIQRSVSDSPVRTPALAVIGTWDPLLPVHKDLFQKLARKGAKTGLTPVVIILFPSPVRLLNRDPDICLEYTDLRARVALIRECSAVKILTVRMTREDLDASTRSFFDLIGSHIALRELWLGANQSLGRLEVCKGSKAGGMALRFLQVGKVRDAIKCAGNAPTWRRPRSGVLRLNWRPGNYIALPISRPSLDTVSTLAPILVKIMPARSGATLEWPAPDVEWLSFVAGPADYVSAGIGKGPRGSRKARST